MKITVTQQNIDEGMRGNSYSCAVAKALLAKDAGADVSVDYETIWFRGHSPRDAGTSFVVTQRMADWLRKFDAHKDVKPTTFQVREIR